MINIGVTIAVIQAGKVLLTKREDFQIWVLPGGAIDPGESIAQAAIRETLEETGLTVTLTRLVGLYSRPAWPIGENQGAHSILFAAEVRGGVLQPQPEEVLEAGFFNPDQLPMPLAWWHRRPIQDALKGHGGGVVWSQHVEFPLPPDITHITRQQLYQLRDQGALPLEEIFEQLCRLPTPEDETLEVGEE